MTRRIMLVISVAVLAVFLLASALFIFQGGFGGGHLRFDHILYWLAFPWFLLPLPEAVWAQSDYLPLVLVPFLMNCAVFLIIFLALRWRANSKTGV